jgi:hypothetical protein
VSLLALPSIIRNLTRVRRYPYLIFCLVSVIGFMVGFSAIFNLGILARQRVQVLPLLLAILIVMGRGLIPDEPASPDDEAAAPSDSAQANLS